MEVGILQNLLFGLFLSALLGGMIGIDKDIVSSSGRSTKKDLDYNFGSVRSFSLISIFGAIAYFIDIQSGSTLYTLLGFVSVTLFVAIHYYNSISSGKDVSPASEFVSILTYFVGILVYMGMVQFAIILAVLLTFLVSSKESLEGIGKYISKDELRTTLKFAAIAFVILPLLPDQRFSLQEIASFFTGGGFQGAHPLLTFSFFNPYSIWFFVVVMSGVSYMGYILTKFLGTSSSIMLSSILGGMVSSTATTASMTQKSKEDPAHLNSYVIGTLLASCIMFTRVFVIVAFFSFALFQAILIPGGIMFVVFLAATFYFYLQSKKEKSKKKISVENKVRSPFRILPALQFAGLIVLIKFISGVGIIYKDIWGEGLFYSALGIISGFADVDAITQTMAVDSGRGLLSFSVAASTILLAVMSNNLVKGSIAWRLGNPDFGKKVMLSFSLSIFAGLITLGVLAFLK